MDHVLAETVQRSSGSPHFCGGYTLLQAIVQGSDSDLRVDHIVKSLRIRVGLRWRRYCSCRRVAIDGRHVVAIRVWCGSQ